LINKKKILALVPARGGSKGIKLKNLKKINGKSLIQITSEFIDKCKFIDLKVLSSDNKKIINHSKCLKFEIVKRSKKLSGDRVSDFQVIQETLIFIKDNLKYNFDYLVYLQPTSPVRKRRHLLDAIKKVIKFKYDGSWSVTKVDTKYHPLKSLKIVRNKLKLFDNRGQRVIARQMLNSVYIRNGVFYIFDIQRLLKNKSIYLEKILPSVTEYKTANIDNLVDLKLAKKLVK